MLGKKRIKLVFWNFLFFCFVYSILTISPALGQEVWIHVGPKADILSLDVLSIEDSKPEKPKVLIKDVPPQDLIVNVFVPGFHMRKATTKGGDFTELDLPSYGFTDQIGKPKLPVIRTIIKGPKEGKIQFKEKVLSPPSMPADIKQWGFPERIIPVQPPIPKIPGAREAAPFVIDEDSYQEDHFQPERLVEIKEVGIQRENKLWLVEVFPMRYNPFRGQIIVSPDLEITVQFEGKNRKDSNSSVNELASQKAGERLLIIYPELFSSDITSFVQHKQNLQYDVTAVSTAQTGSTTEAIKSYIQSRYDNSYTRPDFILLVGDTDTIPHWTGTQTDRPATDLYYVCMDGETDWIPDIAIGRISARTYEQLDDILKKIIYYENNSFSETNWISHAVFMASEDNYTITEGTHDYCISTYLSPRGYTSDKLYSHTFSATTQQVRDAFNNGRSLGIYSGHGSYTSWVDGPPFRQSDVDNLINQNMYPFVGSFACDTGNFEEDECFGETWLRVGNKGSIFFWGSSVTSYWDEDDILEKKLFEAIYTEGAIFMGSATQRAKMLFLTHVGTLGATRRYFEQYNLLGDSSTRLYVLGGTGLDCSNAVSLSPNVPYDGTTVGAPSSVNGYSCSTRDESGSETLHRITTTVSGDITATLSNISVDLDVFILNACDPSSCVAYGDNSAVYSNAPPGTYYIVVDGYYGASASYTLNVDHPEVLPTVTVTVRDSTATEAGPTTGTFTVNRTGDTTAALMVYYTVGGRATPGSDYISLSGNVTIPEGLSTATIMVTPIDDTLVERNETVIVTLSSNSAYTIGSPNTATVKIISDEMR